MPSYIPILTYHSIDSSGSIISTDVEQFTRQIKFLADSDFSVITLGKLVTCIRDGEECPQKSLVITFDDGFKNFFTSALPILEKFGFPATVFLVAGRCGGDNGWPGQMEGIPRFDLLDWPEIESAAARGVEFGAHTMTHPNLTRLPSGQVVEEILQSKQVLQQRLGGACNFFAYPYGIVNPGVRACVEREFKGACSVEMDVVSREADPYLLPRVDMYYFSRNSLHEQLGKPKFLFYVKTRKILRALRKSLSSDA